MLSDLEIEILRRAQAGMERPRPPITVGPVRPPGPVIPFAGAGTSSIATPQTQFGGYGVTMPTTPLMQYAGLSPTKERAPQPDPIVLPPQPAPEPEPIFAPEPAPTPPPPPVVSDPGGGSTSGPTAPGSNYQAGLVYTDAGGPTGYYPGPSPDKPKPPPAPVIPDNASDYGKDVLERAADSNLPPEVVVAMDQQKEDPNAKIDVKIGTFDPTSSKEDLRLSSAPAEISLPEGVTYGGKYYNDPITGNRMYQPPMPKRRPGTMGAQVMPAPIDLTTGKPKESPFGGMLPPAKPTPPKKTPPKKTPPKRPTPPKKTPPKRTPPPRKTPPKPVSGDGRKASGSNRPVRRGPVTKGPGRSKPVPPKRTPPKKTPPKKTPPKRTPPKKPSPPKRPPSSIFDRLPSSGPTGYSV